jgi:hypothetical protein
MSMDNVHHVFEKSQSKGSARTLLLTVAIHGNGCCGVAWPSDSTLRREVNVSRQRIHKLKQGVKQAGELVIIERPGTTNLYFIAEGGKPVGLSLERLRDARRRHEPGCPLRSPTLRQRVISELGGWHAEPAAAVSEERHQPVDNLQSAGGVSIPPDPQVSHSRDTPCHESETQKSSENEREKRESACRRTVSLSHDHGADAPEDVTIGPEVMRKFLLRYSTQDWPPPRRGPVPSQPAQPLASLAQAVDTVLLFTKEGKEQVEQPVARSPEKAERRSPFWCEAHGYCHSERLDDHLPGCWLEDTGAAHNNTPEAG